MAINLNNYFTPEQRAEWMRLTDLFCDGPLGGKGEEQPCTDYVFHVLAKRVEIMQEKIKVLEDLQSLLRKIDKL